MGSASHRVLATLATVLLALQTPPLCAQDGDGAFDGPAHWRLAVAPYTRHFSPDPDHRYAWAVGLERVWASQWLGGGSFFRNSFGQPSGYLYVGRTYPALFDTPELYGQWTAGLLYGYRGEFENKVPFNHNGFSPGAVFALGWRLSEQSAVQLNLLGTSALMLQLSHDFR